MMRLMALAGSPPPRTSSSGACPLSSRSSMRDLLPGTEQEGARSQQIPDRGHKLQRFQRFEQERISPGFDGPIPAFQHRYRDDRHVVVLFEKTAQAEPGPTRYQQFDHHQRRGVIEE